ncbi:hypothetical protein AYO44_15670 [Planctomycetaceae bacterium SCGC AG-212-F19]|nr:hypothetical protein AYO44_15670 [Planctomycetaceae bacterium SCGC AG-212-F19]
MQLVPMLNPAADSPAHLGYEPLPGAYDEMLGPDRAIRPAWQSFYPQIEALGIGELSRRWEEARQLIRENGVTYRVYSDPLATYRPWQLDPIPLLVGSDEAKALEPGLIQRARLLEAILADLYGPQRLLREGLYPRELVFGHPGFLRPCHGLRLPHGRHLYLYAAEVGRGPDGAVCILGDRTQAPSGAGYALENRIVMSRVLPEAFRECRVQRLALFFRTLRDGLRAAAPTNRDNPRIVLLSPGPYNETYFEHAFLARYLGFTLVEGGDLTVRDCRVFLKVLGGLQPVDVILRRLDDDFCDPLELRGNSFLGVPGLVQAVRAGRVAVANALGTGLVETPALLGFLPGLSRCLLGEELLLPSAPTWWCGEPFALDHVLAHLSQMVIKPAFAGAKFQRIFGGKLSRHEQEALVARLKARPHMYVGQQEVNLATAPVLAGGRLEPRHVVMRAYLAAGEDDSFVVMPGGLSRVTASADTLVVSMQQGGGSKDTWLLSPGPVNEFSLLNPIAQPVELSRAGNDLPSRAADNLFWLGRYAERADGAVRLLRGILVRLIEKSGLAEVPELPHLLRALTYVTQTFPGFIEGADDLLAAPEQEVRAIVFDARRIGSLASTLRALHRVAGTVRDRISTDMWRVVNRLDLGADDGRDPPAKDSAPPSAADADESTPSTLSDVLDLLDSAISTLAAFGGLAMESMTRGQGWRFLDMGRRLERSLHTLGLVRHTLIGRVAQEGPLLEALLEIADCSMTYRRRYMSTLQTAPVLDLLLADETNPRSLAFQLAALADDIDHLPREASEPGRSPEQRLMLAMLTALRLANIDALARPSVAGMRAALDELLAKLEGELPILSEAITSHYLTHLLPARHLSSPWGNEEAP